jgi:hypothetical protein
MSEKSIIHQIKNEMGEDKKLKIDIYDDEIVFYLWEREVGICLNKYFYDYLPYIDFEGYSDENAKLDHVEVFEIADIMKVIGSNLVEILSWINIDYYDGTKR